MNLEIALNDLPSPPPGKTGFPWTEQSSPLSASLTRADLPKITIVTPSYNQGEYLEATIRSVLLQSYPNLEYIIIDGGSTDDSVEIIQKYEPWISNWVSEKDRGQSDAINKGFSRSTGVLMGWINSDDLLAKDALQTLARHNKPGMHWWTGCASQILPDGTLVSFNPEAIKPVLRSELLHARAIVCQVATFWTRELWNQTGACIQPLHLALDYELWLRFSEHAPAIPIKHILGIFRTHAQAKTGIAGGMQHYLCECDKVRLKEYYRASMPLPIRTLLITYWTKLHRAKTTGWWSWFEVRGIPYV